MIEPTPAARPRFRLPPLYVALALALSGCAHHQAPPQDWRAVITRKDVARMRQWRSDWVAAVAKAREDGHGAAIDAEGALLNPDAGLDEPMPPAGDYHCRVFAIGSGGGTLTGFTAEPVSPCRINPIGDGVLGFARLEGAQRPIGRIYPGTGAQLTFLGALSVGDESRPFDYGVDQQRSLVGLVERYGPSHWRLVLPHPPFGGAFEVIELVPAT